MIDTVTVLRKELRELLGEKHSLRGVLFQAAFVVVITGIVLPARDPDIWAAEGIAMLYFIFPSMLAAGVAADAFAGERERRTIETLLATPLRARSIFLGKLATALCFALGVSAASLLSAVVTANLARRMPVPFVPPLLVLAGVLGGALSASLLTSAIAIHISSRVAVARSVQQIMPMVCMGLVGATAFVLDRLGIPLEWPVILRLEAAMLAVGMLATFVALRRFRRDRFFDSR
ncbi:MAG: hypothetical protein NVS2B9_13950 [Myxococcales bacterium]